MRYIIVFNRLPGHVPFVPDLYMWILGIILVLLILFILTIGYYAEYRPESYIARVFDKYVSE